MYNTPTLLKCCRALCFYGFIIICQNVHTKTGDYSMDTIWLEGIQMPIFPQLDRDLHTDVLIIGGGLAGLLGIWNLTRAGVDCVLIEQNRIMSGVSGRTTAKLTAQHGLIYGKLLERFGPEKAKLYWRVNQDAVTALAELAQSLNCDFQFQNSYLYTTDSTKELETELAACRQLGIPVQWEDKLQLPFPVAGGLKLPDQGQFHPLKLAAHLTNGLRIYENTKALAFLGNQVQTPKGTITAQKIIVATHFPMLNKHGAYFLKLYQQRSYVIALENAQQPEGIYLDCAENGLSLRSARRYLLLGGGGHRTGKQGLNWELPEAVASKYYPDAKIVARWATQDCMTLDGMPYIGAYSSATPNLFVATGFQKWGMSTSMAAASILTDLLQDQENSYASLFSPQRSMMHKQLLVNGLETTANLILPTKPRCPHLGCALHWNKAEHSWDCSCHGSRFDEKGRVLNNPAVDNLKHRPE